MALTLFYKTLLAAKLLRGCFMASCWVPGSQPPYTASGENWPRAKNTLMRQGLLLATNKDRSSPKRPSLLWIACPQNMGGGGGLTGRRGLQAIAGLQAAVAPLWAKGNTRWAEISKAKAMPLESPSCVLLLKAFQSCSAPQGNNSLRGLCC